jgi:dinuclear metal center YbgI/SA1388 family protein
MPITVQSICDAMEAWAPSSLAYDWDSVGLQIGNPNREVARVLSCLTVTPEVVERAERWDAQMIVSHHPVLFRPLKHLRTTDPQTRLCLRLAARDIACFAAHTNLDVVPGGVNTILAEDLGLGEIRPLIPIPKSGQVKLITFVPQSHLAPVRAAVTRAGAGEIGDYLECSFSTPGTGTFRPGASANPFSGAIGMLNEEPELRFEVLVPRVRLPKVLRALLEAHPYEEPAYDIVPLDNTDPRFALGARGALARSMTLEKFARHVCRALKLRHVRVVGKPGLRIRQVAVCGGAGGGEIPQIPRDIDVYVTGDLKYHEADAARMRGLALIDAGHVGTERNIATHMARYLRKKLPGVKTKAIIEPEIFTTITNG